jgi:hypothetical protein
MIFMVPKFTGAAYFAATGNGYPSKLVYEGPMIINLLATWIPALGIAFLGVLKLTGNPRVAEEMPTASRLTNAVATQNSL